MQYLNLVFKELKGKSTIDKRKFIYPCEAALYYYWSWGHSQLRSDHFYDRKTQKQNSVLILLSIKCDFFKPVEAYETKVWF